MTRADLVALILLLAVNAALYARFWQAPTPAQAVEIRGPDGFLQRVPLTVNRDLRVPGRNGDSVLRIEGGQIRFIDSPCRNRICIHSGWHRHAGATAACVPNGVSIRLIGTEAIDGVAY